MKAYTQDELSALGTPSPLLIEHMKEYPPPGSFDSEAYDPNVDRTRKARIAHLKTRRPFFPIPGPIPDIVNESDIFVDYPPAKTKLQVRVYSATDLSGVDQSSGVPIIVLMHEGGWMLGDMSDEEHNARLFASSFDCVVLNIEYLLMPEHPFPASIKSCCHVLETLCSSPKTFHPLADPSLGIVLGGSSAGGNLTAVLAHYARQERLEPPVTGQWLSVPFITPTELVPDKYKALFNSHSSRVDPVIDPGDTEETFKTLYNTLQIKTLDDALVSYSVCRRHISTDSQVHSICIVPLPPKYRQQWSRASAACESLYPGRWTRSIARPCDRLCKGIARRLARRCEAEGIWRVRSHVLDELSAAGREQEILERHCQRLRVDDGSTSKAAVVGRLGYPMSHVSPCSRLGATRSDTLRANEF